MIDELKKVENIEKIEKVEKAIDTFMETHADITSDDLFLYLISILFSCKNDKGDDSKCTEIPTTTNNNDTNQLT